MKLSAIIALLVIGFSILKGLDALPQKTMADFTAQREEIRAKHWQDQKQCAFDTTNDIALKSCLVTADTTNRQRVAAFDNEFKEWSK